MIIQLRIRRKNLAALEEGFDVEHVWLTQGADGVWALGVVSECPLPAEGKPPRD